MKKTNLVYLIILSCILISSSESTAQTSADEFRKFGAGVSFQPFGIANILEEFEGVPITKFNVAINITKGFRTEINLGYYSRNNKSSDSKYNAFNGGIGFLGTKRIEDNVIMGGIKVDYTAGESTYENAYGSQTEDKFNRTAFGPVLAYEHLFGGRFGIGGELGLSFSSYKEDPGNSEEENVESTTAYTDSAIFVRIYF